MRNAKLDMDNVNTIVIDKKMKKADIVDKYWQLYEVCTTEQAELTEARETIRVLRIALAREAAMKLDLEERVGNAETAANAPVVPKTTPKAKEDHSNWAPNLTAQQNRWWDEQAKKDPRMNTMRSGF